jgi:hypothetical protein
VNIFKNTNSAGALVKPLRTIGQGKTCPVRQLLTRLGQMDIDTNCF